VTLDLIDLLPPDWREAMAKFLEPAALDKLAPFVESEYATETVFPPLPDVFAALRLSPLDQARVVILGQDPYHRAGQAHGLSFSVQPGVKVPPSLRNVFKEMRDDLSVEMPTSGNLTGWAQQGAVLLNTVLTVREGKPASHAGKGWETVTDAAIHALNARADRVVFLLWGAHARQKVALVTNPQHVVLEAGHPSPMNPRGFLGSRPFSAANAALIQAGHPPIDWSATTP
jgi:uracil-DNA glycosylase